MAVISGNLTDFSLDALAPYSPRLTFIPSQPATAGGRLFATKPFSVRVDSTTGAFSVDVQPTDNLIPAAYYTIRVDWLDSDGGFVGVDFPDWRITVPAAGGAIGDLLASPVEPSLVWVGLTAPRDPVPGTWWLKSNPNDLTDPRNTGELFVWQ